MPQTYPDITLATDTVKNGISFLKSRTDALRSSFSGTTAPTSDVIGQLWYDTTTGTIKVLTSSGPSVWTKFLTGVTSIADGGTGATTQGGARTALGLGTVAVLNTGVASGNIPTVAEANGLYAKLTSNLGDLPSPSSARTALGLGALAVQATVGVGQLDNGAVNTTAKIANGVVTYAKMQAATTGKLLGGVSGAVGEVTVGSGLSFINGELSSSVSGSGGVILAMKSTTQVTPNTANSRTTITGLQFSVGAFETWSAEFDMVVTGGNQNANYYINVPSGVTTLLFSGLCGTNSTSHRSDSTDTSSTPILLYLGLSVVRLTVSLVVGVNPGTVSVDFSPTANAGASIVAGSRLVARKH